MARISISHSELLDQSTLRRIPSALAGRHSHWVVALAILVAFALMTLQKRHDVERVNNPTNVLQIDSRSPIIALNLQATTLTPTATPLLVTLSLLPGRDTLILSVPDGQPVNLAGLNLRAVDDSGNLQAKYILVDFSSLQLTNGIADTNSCFVYRLAGTEDPLPSICSRTDRVFRLDVALADVFWYDSVRVRQRDIAVYRDETLITICSASVPQCSFSWENVPVTVTPRSVFAAAPTLTPPGIVPDLVPTVISNVDWQPTFQTFGNVQMALVPPGCFIMGSDTGEPNERPAHRHCLDQPYWIDVYEVTNSQYGSSGGFAGADRPREDVTYFEARQFCLTRDARLPTEAEWEYAARGPDSLIYPWGNTFDGSNLVYKSPGQQETSPAGSKPAGRSWVGVYDLSGNVWEWTSSIHFPYPYNPDDGRENDADTDTSSYRVIKGGSWDFGREYETRAAWRGGDGYALDQHDNGIGFRCVRDA